MRVLILALLQITCTGHIYSTVYDHRWTPEAAVYHNGYTGQIVAGPLLRGPAPDPAITVALYPIRQGVGENGNGNCGWIIDTVDWYTPLYGGVLAGAGFSFGGMDWTTRQPLHVTRIFSYERHH